MVDSIGPSSALQFQPGNYARQSSGGSSKVKLDVNSAPQSKVKIETSSGLGQSKGVKIDIKT